MSVPKIEGKMVKPVKNKKLTKEVIDKVKETNTMTKEDYVQIASNNAIKEVEPQALKMKEENALGVPHSFYDLSIENQNMIMFYLDPDFYNEDILEKTHMNVLASYVTAYLDEKEIEKIWDIRKVPVKDDKGNVLGWDFEKKIKNYKKYNETKVKALETFHKNPKIHETWQGLIKLHFGVNPKDLLQNAILQDALHAQNYQDKNANRKMAMDMFGMGKETNNGIQINVYEDGGGKNLAHAIKNFTEDDYVVTDDDLDVD